MLPLNRHNVIAPSSNASTSLYLASMATGQKTTSKLASTSRIFSPIFNTAISQPPQAAAQYIANFGFVPFSVMPPPPAPHRSAFLLPAEGDCGLHARSPRPNAGGQAREFLPLKLQSLVPTSRLRRHWPTPTSRG